ncbi:hypothetical protein BGX38DRAFT_1196191 [Terfezia claveryi]|nr:hypothetical protein BGX38DRAFT_1196191 [Terfezia claveryi]
MPPRRTYKTASWFLIVLPIHRILSNGRIDATNFRPSIRKRRRKMTDYAIARSGDYIALARLWANYPSPNRYRHSVWGFWQGEGVKSCINMSLLTRIQFVQG